MRPVRQTPVHQTGDFAELVCSNSLRGNALDQAAGLLKEEMRRMDSLVIRVADSVRVPAGQRARRRPRAVRAADHRGGGGAAPGARPPPRDRAHPRRPGDHRGHRPADLGRAGEGDRVLRGPRPPLLLRRGEPGDRRGDHRSRPRLPGLALREGRRRLPELPARRRDVPRVPRRAHHRRERDPARVRARVLLRGLPPGGGHRQPRVRHPALRPHEAGRAHRSRGRAAGPSRSSSCARTTWRPAISRWSASRPSSSGASRRGSSG